MKKTLHDILLDMQNVEHISDQEVAHERADDLLVEALHFLAQRFRQKEIRETTEDIIHTYERVGKWYG